MLEEAKRDCYEGDYNSEGEDVMRHNLRACSKVNLNDVVYKDEACDDKALSSLYAIDASVYVDRICAEHCKGTHIHMVQNAKVDKGAKERSQKLRHNDICYSVVGDKQRKCCNCGHNQFVSPFKIEDVINETKKHSHACCKKACVVLN